MAAGKWRPSDFSVLALMDLHGFDDKMKQAFWLLLQKYREVAKLQKVYSSTLRDVFLATCIVLGVPVSFELVASLHGVKKVRMLRWRVKKILSALGYGHLVQRVLELELRGCCRHFLMVEPSTETCNTVVDFVMKFLEKYSSIWPTTIRKYSCLVINACRLLRKAGAVEFCPQKLYMCRSTKKRLSIRRLMKEFLEEYLKSRPSSAQQL